MPKKEKGMPNLYKYFYTDTMKDTQGKMVPLRYELSYSSANVHVSFLCVCNKICF